jgi:hypothetical protein
MPEANQYTFTHKELTEMLVRQAGLHEGRWMLMLTLGFGPGNFGPSESEVVPGAIVTITNVGIQKAPAESPSSLTVDAAVVNPQAKEKRRSPR